MTKTKQTITINGRHYNAATGLVLGEPKKSEAQPKIISDISVRHAPVPAHLKARAVAPALVNKAQKSTTLRRSILTKPAARRSVAVRTHKKVERSQQVSRFAPPENPVLARAPEVDRELAEQTRQLEDAHIVRIRRQAVAHVKPAISSHAIKEHLLKKQLENAPLTPPHHLNQASQMSRRTRVLSVASTCLALVLLGGYLTYINIPNLSIRVAAANAGINATLPRYQPDGYRIHGPIAYSDGQVSVNYQQDGGRQDYTIVQKASDWDPQATLDNYVAPQSNNNYQIHSIEGLTVYTYNHKAVWVNSGMLHTLGGNALLSGQQIDQIAVSM